MAIDTDETTVQGASPNAVKILKPRPGRLYFLVTVVPDSNTFFVWFSGGNQQTGIAPTGNNNVVYVSRGSMPGLVDGEVYAWAGALTTLHIIEAWDTNS